MYSFAQISHIKAEVFPLFSLPAFIAAVLLFFCISTWTQSVAPAVPIVLTSPEVPVVVVPAVYSTLPLAVTVPVVAKPTVVVKPTVVAVVASSPAIVIPVAPKPPEARLLIPKIQVNAVVKSLGDTAAGAMAVPNNRFDVSWYNRGTRPGGIGSAVIGGHNYWNGVGVFVGLDQLVVGDTMSYVNAEGGSTSFVVTGTRTYMPTDDATDIFQSASGRHLNLITCSGVWDPATNTYSTRLVVFADLLVTA